MKVLKFGGTSVKDEVNIKKVLQILLKREDDITVVFSAMGGVTDTLIELSSLAANRDNSYTDVYKQLKKRHFSAAKSLLNAANYAEVKTELDRTHTNLKKLLAGVQIIGEISPRTMDYILSFGERTSSYIIAAALTQRKRKSAFLDARSILLTDSNYGNASLLKDASHRKVRAYYKKAKGTQIVTGFIASDKEGKTTTLGRGGSDYTAAILAEALRAKAIEIWTDVDGILSADPRKVNEAFTIPQVSYQEAMELSHFGAKVIYPPTIKPALDRKIPVYIKNTFNPDFAGTVIKDKSWSHEKPVIGVSAVSDIVLVSLEGSGLFGVPGIAARLFGALAMKQINIILITQCSSEHSISFAVKPNDSQKAVKVINETFISEIDRGSVNPVKVEKDLSIVAVIGENMKSTPGISAKLFQSMGRNGINIVAIAQGSSELNISVVVKQKDQLKALNTLHEAFFSDDIKDIHLYVVGVGLIGGTLIDQINAQKRILAERHGINLNICGIANSRKMFFSNEEFTSDEWMQKLKASRKKMTVSKFVDTMIAENKRNAIFIDNTSSEIVVEEYFRVLDNSISISTPNKIGASADLVNFKNLKSISAKRGVKYGYETNVGAGLPVISTLQDLIKSGDKIEKIEAVLSGSLSYIFNNFDGRKAFSEVVTEAKELGFTEPDPREDLNGYDVRRKILILGREAGFDLQEKDVELDFFLSNTARKAKTVDLFFKVLEKDDDNLRTYVEKLNAEGKKPRMIAEYGNGKAKVGVVEVESNSPFYGLEGSDNMIVFTTERYHDRPLVIKGPGAGAEVTAAGVLAEILRIANSI
ncbi:bifunctional aspartate kinase/homoserine dehydrogenase I [Saprospiraceae bacterium]|nr:bifunctional aspartate kinase/homoserine dehydrogenase I [Saprospiraceae bacterium]